MTSNTKTYLVRIALVAVVPMMAALALGSAPALAQTTVAPAVETADAFERDRQSILAQAGQFRVRFDMRETVSFRDGYEPLEEKLSGGNEIVRVVYDHGDRISLQHILVMEHEGEVMVIKHWRQDWAYEPETVLTYAGPDEWELTPVSEADRAGAWSQTVWQTDDSPRYGGVGRWTYDNGMAEWVSGPTWRPLARRDAVRDPVYDRYLGSNRHALTPWGWVHIQDNLKMAGAEGSEDEPVAVVHEDVVNTYRRWDGYDAGPGDAYWAATQAYWSAVRDAWDGAIAESGGIHVEEEAQTGAVTGPPLMGLAQQIQDGTLSSDAAIVQARTIIVTATQR
jgi:hypothetical protein